MLLRLLYILVCGPAFTHLSQAFLFSPSVQSLGHFHPWNISQLGSDIRRQLFETAAQILRQRLWTVSFVALSTSNFPRVERERRDKRGLLKLVHSDAVRKTKITVTYARTDAYFSPMWPSGYIQGWSHSPRDPLSCCFVMLGVLPWRCVPTRLATSLFHALEEGGEKEGALIFKDTTQKLYILVPLRSD